MARIIESPGVQLSEIDLSLNASLPVGTNILVNGFTDQGPSQELLNVTSITEYEQIYGVPTNAAERYSYHTIKNLLSTPAKVVFNRLPYGNESGIGFNSEYTAMLYPSYVGVAGTLSGELGATSPLSNEGTYYIGKPTQISITESEYNAWKQGDIVWSSTTAPLSGDVISGPTDIANTAMIIVNKVQTSVNQDFEGYYIGLSDNTKANATAGAKDFEYNSLTSIETSKGAIAGVTSGAQWEALADSRLDFELTGNVSDKPNSLSEAVETVPTWDFGDVEYNDAIVIGLYKFRRSGYATNQNALTFISYEGYTGSLGASRKYTEPDGFQETSFYIETLVNDESAFLDVMINPNLSSGNWVDNAGNPNRNIIIMSDAETAELMPNEIPLSTSTVSSFEGVGGDYTLSGDYISGATLYISGDNVFELTNDVWSLSTATSSDIFTVTGLSGDMIPPETGWIGDQTVPELSGATLALTFNYTDFSNLKANSAFTLGLYQEMVESVKAIGDIPTKLDLGLRLAEDWDTLPLDILLDGGLSTIHTTMKSLTGDVEFVDSKPVTGISSLQDSTTGAESDIALAWLTIFNKFDTFCRDTRQDCMFIADTYRNVFVNGKDFKTLADKTKNFSQHIYTPLKNLTSKCNSSYSTTYAQWIKVYDNRSSDYAWIPYSGFQGAIMSRLDSKLFPWSAPAGLENGNVVGALDIALGTTQKQRDLLYRNNLNAVVFFPSDGIVCWGQKTLQKKPSAFDRINVRRLFLTLEKSTRSLMKYFVFQPNTTFTRTRVVNILTPIFDVAKNNEGVYDYLIVCDERNNTAAVIDNNELQVDIYLKPVRTAEFILVNFYATRTDQNFSELI